MDVLPNELLLKIFSHCDKETVYKLSISCHKSRSLLKQNARKIRALLSVQEMRLTFDADSVELYRQLPLPWDAKPAHLPGFEWNELCEAKRIVRSGETARFIWDHIWYMETETIAITINDQHCFVEIMEEIANSWWERIDKLFFYSTVPCDILAVLSKLKECSTFNLEMEECQGKNVNKMIEAVTKVRVFELRGNTQNLTCDDTTLDLLIAKSNKDPMGLEKFWIYGCQHRYSMEKIKEFLKTAKFVAKEAFHVHLFLGSIVGRKTDFVAFLEEEKADLRGNTNDSYHFIMNNTEFAISINNFVK